MLSNAESRAKALVDEAEKRAAALLGDAEGRLVADPVERESVAGYIENLRGVLAQAETVAAEHGFPVSAPDEPEAQRTEQDADGPGRAGRRRPGRRGRRGTRTRAHPLTLAGPVQPLAFRYQ